MGGGGAGGTRTVAANLDANSGGTGGTGGTSSIVKSGITTISTTGPTGGFGGYVNWDGQFFAGGTGASNALYSGASGYSSFGYSLRYMGGGGGAGAGSNGSFPNPYYNYGFQGSSGIITGSDVYGYGGYGGAWSARLSSNLVVGSGGAGGAGADDATYGPGFTGYGGGVYLRWLI